MRIQTEAVHVVRTVGQAFEVCHKRSSAQQQSDPPSKPPAAGKQDGKASALC